MVLSSFSIHVSFVSTVHGQAWGQISKCKDVHLVAVPLFPALPPLLSGPSEAPLGISLPPKHHSTVQEPGVFTFLHRTLASHSSSGPGSLSLVSWPWFVDVTTARPNHSHIRDKVTRSGEAQQGMVKVALVHLLSRHSLAVMWLRKKLEELETKNNPSTYFAAGKLRKDNHDVILEQATSF